MNCALRRVNCPAGHKGAIQITERSEKSWRSQIIRPPLPQTAGGGTIQNVRCGKRPVAAHTGEPQFWVQNCRDKHRLSGIRYECNLPQGKSNRVPWRTMCAATGAGARRTAGCRPYRVFPFLQRVRRDGSRCGMRAAECRLPDVIPVCHPALPWQRPPVIQLRYARFERD